MNTKTTLTNTGGRRLVGYIPPNGRIMEDGEIIDIPGILDTEIYLGQSSGITELDEDILAGRVTVTYAIPGLSTDTLSKLNGSDKDLVPLATPLANQQDTGLAISETPVGGGYVQVSVNGIGMSLGDGVLTSDFYFSNDAGASAKNIANVAAGDALFFNGLIAGFPLATTDRISMLYSVSALV